MGAVYISPNGLFAAPSGVVPGELGLFALVLFYPGEFLGNFEGMDVGCRDVACDAFDGIVSLTARGCGARSCTQGIRRFISASHCRLKFFFAALWRSGCWRFECPADTRMCLR